MHSEGRYGVEAGLVGWWRLMDANEGVNDIVGTNNCTLNGGMGYGSGGGRRYAVFDGVNDYVATTGNVASITGDFSISFWAKTTVSGTNNILVNRYVGGDASQMYIEIDAGPIRMVLWDGTTGIRKSSSSVNTGVWVHVAFVRSGSGLNVYVNGILDNGSTSGSLTKTITAGVLEIGAALYAAIYFAGDLSDLRIYNRALSAAEIARLARIY